jgi:hypothetical protein
MSDEYELLEIMYWEFDARRKGYGEYKHRPQSERDAFKAVIRKHLKQLIDMADETEVGK